MLLNLLDQVGLKHLYDFVYVLSCAGRRSSDEAPTIKSSEHGPPHNHRGFGFVIYTSQSADQMLGTGYSRFIPVRENGHLEVRREQPLR